MVKNWGPEPKSTWHLICTFAPGEVCNVIPAPQKPVFHCRSDCTSCSQIQCVLLPSCPTPYRFPGC